MVIMTKKGIQQSIVFPPDMHAKILDLAARGGISFSDMVRMLLNDALKKVK